MKKVTYSAPDMHCLSCVMLLEGLEDELEGVVSVLASSKRQEVSVIFDESIVSEETIKQAAQKEGYALISKG